MLLPVLTPLLWAGELGLCWKEFNQTSAAPILPGPVAALLRPSIALGCWEGLRKLGQFEVGGSKCALRDTQRPQGALAGGKVGERVMGHLDFPSVFHGSCDHRWWVGTGPSSLRPPPLVWVGPRLAFLELLSASGFTSKWRGLLISAPQSLSPQT